MDSCKSRKTLDEMRAHIVSVAANLFLENGYTNSTLRNIAQSAEINIGSLMNIFSSKEEILCDMITVAIEKQYNSAATAVDGLTEDKLLFYAVETTLQLHIVEMNENLREVYCMAYSMPKTSEVLQQLKTCKLEKIFKEHLPNLETKDFFKLEIAIGGIMRGFMTIPCNMWFTMEQKIAAFLETTFLIYRVSDEKIKEAIEFVKQFDFEKIAKETVGFIVEQLELNSEYEKEVVK